MGCLDYLYYPDLIRRIWSERVTSDSTPLHLAVALDGAGWHPAAWREPRARPAELLTGRYWADVIAEAERGLLDFVTIEDGFTVQSARADRVAGRLDAVLIAARVAPLTRHIGLIPTVVVTHTEPFHISKAIATLDYVSNGRAGVRVRVSASPQEAALFGRRDFPDLNLGTATIRPRGGCWRGCSTRRPTRRGHPAAVGQLGRRRRDPRCRNRPVRRPRQAALHRLRWRLLQRQGPVDHPAAAAGTADRGRPGARDGAVRADR